MISFTSNDNNTLYILGRAVVKTYLLGIPLPVVFFPGDKKRKVVKEKHVQIKKNRFKLV